MDHAFRAVLMDLENGSVVVGSAFTCDAIKPTAVGEGGQSRGWFSSVAVFGTLKTVEDVYAAVRRVHFKNAAQIVRAAFARGAVQ